MWNPFKNKKSHYTAVTATSEPFPAASGFSYVLSVPSYFNFPSRKTGIVLESPSIASPPSDKDFSISSLVVLEAIVIEEFKVRFIFSQKYSDNQSVKIGKFHYLLCKEDYLKGRLKTTSLVLGSTHCLTIFFCKEPKNTLTTDALWEDFHKLFDDGRFSSLFSDLDRSLGKFNSPKH